MTTYLAKGDLLEGRYRILDRIGEGAMGVVYTAEHIMLHRPCAIKVLHPSESDDQTMFKRFEVEAQTAANVRHTNIVEVMDFGITPDDLPFLVMERLEGESLADRLGLIGKLTIPEAAVIIEQILKGLGAAHKRGVIHRDLKPDNIFLAEEGRGEVVKILDFGISKIMGGTPSRAPDMLSGKHKGLTQRGMVMGTPGYMAPETLFGADTVDARADIFSVAVMLFEMLVGKTPFHKADPHSTMVATASEEPPDPRQLEPTVTDAMAEVILKGLEKKPEHRYQTSEKFLKALTGARAKPEPKAPTTYARVTPGRAVRGNSVETPKADPLELDYSRVDLPRTPPAPKQINVSPVMRRVRKRSLLDVPILRYAIAFSPVPILLLLGLSGAYYYFVHRETMRLVTEVDPVTREIARRAARQIDTGEEIVVEIPVETVSISVDAEPSDLKIFWDGEIRYDQPLIVPKGERAATVRFKSPGFEEETMSITPDADKTVDVRLKPVEKAPPPRGKNRKK